MTASIRWFCLLACLSIDPTIDPAGSQELMDDVANNPILEGLLTAAATMIG